MVDTGLTVLLHRITRHGPIQVTIGNATLGFLSQTEVWRRLGDRTAEQIAAIMADLNEDGGEHRLDLTNDRALDRVLEYWRGHPTPDDV